MSDEWVFIKLDEKTARRQGVPAELPVPKSAFERISEKGLQPNDLRGHISTFLAKAPSSWRSANPKLAARFDAFIGKLDIFAKAEQAFAKSDHPGAIRALKLITNVDPEDHAARMNLGSALAASGDFEGALKQFETIRSTFDDQPDFFVTLGNTHLAGGNREKATDAFVRALELNGSSHDAMKGLVTLGVLVAVYENPKDATSLVYVRRDSLAEYVTGVWDQKARDADYYFEQLAYHASEDRHDVALLAAERALKANGAERAALARIDALRSLGRLDEAAVAAQALIASNGSSSGYVSLARVLSAIGDKVGADAAAKEALSRDPGELMALDILYWPRDQKDVAQVQAAIPALLKHTEANPRSAGALRSLARARKIAGAAEQALDDYRQAVELTPEDDDLRAEYWTELGRSGHFDRVVADAESLNNLSSRDWKLRWNEAEAHAALGNKMQAQAGFFAINHDAALHIDLRKRAKRAAEQLMK